MKPTLQLTRNDRHDSIARASRPGFPKTDYHFQSSSLTNAGGRCFGSRQPSFRAISQDYFKYEAPRNFVREAALFSVIVLTTAVPLISTAYALVHLMRAFASI